MLRRSISLLDGCSTAQGDGNCGSAGVEESIVRGYTVKRDRGAQPGIVVNDLPPTPKAARTPFSGSQLTFRLTDDGTASFINPAMLHPSMCS